MTEEKYPLRIECPLCGTNQQLILTRDAVLADLDKMFNVISKKKVKDGLNYLMGRCKLHDNLWHEIDSMKKELI